jgi:hypothetical protein
MGLKYIFDQLKKRLLNGPKCKMQKEWLLFNLDGCYLVFIECSQ